MARKPYLTDLTDEQWSFIKPLIPQAEPGGRPRTVDVREVVNGILYLVRTGGAWRHLPHEFPPWGTTHYYYRRWRLDGTWGRIHDKIREKVRRQVDKQPTPSAGCLDSQSVKTDAPSKTVVMATTQAKKPLAASVF